MNRRQLLAAGASAFVAALSGCASPNGDGGADTTPTETATGTTTTTETTSEPTATTEETTATATTTQPSGDRTVVTVAPGGSLEFDPEQVTVSTGTTVRWEWDSGGHNVRPDSQPADANWGGTEGGDGTTYGSGHTYEFTFDVAGTYEYYCAPHRSVGMTGTVVVE